MNTWLSEAEKAGTQRDAGNQQTKDPTNKKNAAKPAENLKHFFK